MQVLQAVLLFVVLPSLVLCKTPNKPLFGGSLQSSLSHVTPSYFEKRDADGKCWPGFAPEKDQLLDTCCWYNDETCCSESVASQIIPQFQKDLKTIYSELGAKTQCYAALASFVCFLCAPNTASFIKGTPTTTVTINLCSEYCDAMYYACKNDLGKLFPDPTVITSGNTFCEQAFASDPDTNGQSIIFDTNLDADCFQGYDLDEVENSGCLPGVKPPSHKKSQQYAKVIGALAAVIALLVIGIGGIIGVLIYKHIQKKKRGEVNGRDFSLLNDTDDGIN